uniref:hypothetical protein n=1 Tax=Coprococcus sp. TaxID=2049024 RepID=UPI0040261DC4
MILKLMIVCLVIYIGLLICSAVKAKEKGAYKRKAAVQFAQTVVWILIAWSSWADSTKHSVVLYIVYAVIIVQSIIPGVRALYKKEQD